MTEAERDPILRRALDELRKLPPPDIGAMRRVVAAAKRRETTTMRDIEIARTSLFPLGKSQERVLNFIPMLARHGEALLAQMRARAAEHAEHILSGQPSDASDERVGAPR